MLRAHPSRRVRRPPLRRSRLGAPAAGTVAASGARPSCQNTMPRRYIRLSIVRLRRYAAGRRASTIGGCVRSGTAWALPAVVQRRRSRSSRSEWFHAPLRSPVTVRRKRRPAGALWLPRSVSGASTLERPAAHGRGDLSCRMMQVPSPGRARHGGPRRSPATLMPSGTARPGSAGGAGAHQRWRTRSPPGPGTLLGGAGRAGIAGRSRGAPCPAARAALRGITQDPGALG